MFEKRIKQLEKNLKTWEKDCVVVACKQRKDIYKIDWHYCRKDKRIEDLIYELKQCEKILAKKNLKECCKECGFPVDIERKPIFITKNIASYMYEILKCKSCGHQKTGSTIPAVYEHIKQLRKRWERKQEDKEEILEAEHQFLGFALGSQGYSIRELVSSMGLKKSEWKILKKENKVNSLKKDDIEEVDEILETGK